MSHGVDLLCNFFHMTIFTLLIIILCVILSGEAKHILESIQRLKDRLSDLIEPNFGLLEHLLREQVLTPRQYDEIRSKKTIPVYKRNNTILECLVSEDQCGKFLKALNQTGQPHVENYIKQNGG